MFKHIMVAISDAEDTEQTMATVAALAKAFSAEVTVFHARERIVAPHEVKEQETIAESSDYGHRMAAQLTADGVTTRVVIESIRPDRLSDHILAHADAEGVGLIVIGGHHAHNIREAVFGDIGKTLAHHAHCPLLLMPSTAPVEHVTPTTTDG